MISPQDSVGVQVADTLPQIFHEACVPKDTLAAVDLQTVSETVTGVDGISIPYSPRTDDGLAMILLGCFFISSYVLARSKKFLLQQVKDFMLHRERTSIFASSTAADMRYLLLLTVQTCVLGGVCIFNYFNDVRPSLMEHVSPHLLLGVYVAVCIFYFLFKWIIYSFLGWVFFDKSKTDIWLESYSTLIYYLGFALFPFVLFLVYFDLNVTFLVSIGCILVIFTKILMFYKWLKLFSCNIYGVFLLILYFCALEIIPCLIVYQGLIQLNNVLIINF
ncbi:DUF4271 domain-containing protein [Bacteroides fragilis]|uniref:DUF4271 domain-containing protein n=1 Tax=Bacteroides fragilis TaxID=817 RepID=UPI002455802F|nr:DUF4271 domain-containing protein [Bacteroides fragilis]